MQDNRATLVRKEYFILVLLILENLIFTLKDFLGYSREKKKCMQVLRDQFSSWKFMTRFDRNTEKILSETRCHTENLSLPVEEYVIHSWIDFENRSVHREVILQNC